MQVTTNGYFTFGDQPYLTCCPTLFTASYFPTYVVAPFWTDIDTREAGNVSYRVITSGTFASIVEDVSEYVSRKMNVTFSGKWMIVAEWNSVHEYGTSKPYLVSWQVVSVDQWSLCCLASVIEAVNLYPVVA